MTNLNRRQLLAGISAFGLLPAAALGQSLDRRPAPRPTGDTRNVVASAALRGDVAYALIDPTNGAMLKEQSPAMQLPPASTLKVITALYALSRLGGSHRFRTRVIRDGDTLILAGGGDPVLSTDDLAKLADDLVAASQTSPARFAVWGGALPQIEEIAPPQADHLAYNPALSGMILNFNRVHLGWRRTNGQLQLSLEARAARNSPRAYSISAAPADQSDLFGYRSTEDGEEWSVSRSALRQPGSRWLPVRKPELYAGDVFQTLCRARGLVLPKPEVQTQTPQGTELVSHESQPLTEILRDMLYYSTNLTAEVVGLHASKADSLPQSAQAMQAWLTSQGQGTGFHLADHSGLAADSRVSAAGMGRLLAGPGIAMNLPDLLKQEPLDEDLGKDPARAVHVSAKTGTLNFVSNLAGYVRNDAGPWRAFAVMCVDAPRNAATSGQDLPSGVISWTKEAKRLQRQVLNSWASA